MKWQTSFAVALAAVGALAAIEPEVARAAEGCVRPLGGPCISAPAGKGTAGKVCKTRLGTCKVSLPAGARCRCKGVPGTVQP